MKKTITRRDFLNGAAIAVVGAGTVLPRSLLALEQQAKSQFTDTLRSSYYPPTLTGIRGSHDGSYEVAHELAWNGNRPEQYEQSDETYDLVIVGGGISGLSAAYLYLQKAGADKKVLILDNHDDFGGHAKRNEFHSGGHMLLGIGGSVNLETYAFSDTVNRVLAELGIDFDRLNKAREPGYMLANFGAESSFFLNKNTYKNNQLVPGLWSTIWSGNGDTQKAVDSLNLPSDQAERLVSLIEGDKDLLDDLSVFETKHYAETTSYEEFLINRAGLSSQTIKLFEPMTKILFGTANDSISTADAFLYGYPGANSIGYAGKLFNKALSAATGDMQLPLFPDGNATVARLMVRKLIPAVAPGSTMEDIITARFDYSQLDRSDSPVRIRLNSTAVNVKNVDSGVEVAYVQNGTAYKVQAENSILACYNGIIPHLCPELPEEQKEHLKYGVKIPLVMTNVLLRSGAAVHASGPTQYLCPGSYYSVVTKAPPVSLGNYKDISTGDNPLVLWMAHAPAPNNNGKQSTRDLYRLGRHQLYRTPFASYEQEVKQQLTDMFGHLGFDAERDIEAITVNRWSHGYAYEYNRLFDPEWEEGQAPHELGRAPIGRISIANSDSEAYAYLQSAIDAAERAVNEIQA
ncbi:MAG: FAD-dependent oxidoreductase [Porticoccaceae bacterium]